LPNSSSHPACNVVSPEFQHCIGWGRGRERGRGRGRGRGRRGGNSIAFSKDSGAFSNFSCKTQLAALHQCPKDFFSQL